jgi:hypothetical protein
MFYVVPGGNFRKFELLTAMETWTGGSLGDVQTPSPACPHRTQLAVQFRRMVPYLCIDTFQRPIDIVLAMITAQNVISPMPWNSSVGVKRRRV